MSKCAFRSNGVFCQGGWRLWWRVAAAVVMALRVGNRRFIHQFRMEDKDLAKYEECHAGTWMYPRRRC